MHSKQTIAGPAPLLDARLHDAMRQGILPRLDATDLGSLAMAHPDLRALLMAPGDGTLAAAARRQMALALPPGAGPAAVLACLNHAHRAGNALRRGGDVAPRRVPALPQASSVSPDGSRLARIAPDGSLRVGDPRGDAAKSYAATAVLEPLRTVVWSPDGASLWVIGAARGGRQEELAARLDLATGTLGPPLPLATRGGTRALVVAPDGASVARIAPDNTLALHDGATLEPLPWAGNDAPNGAVNSLSWSSDGAHLLLRFAPSPGAAVLAVRGGARLLCAMPRCLDATFAPNGRHLAYTDFLHGVKLLALPDVAPASATPDAPGAQLPQPRRVGVGTMGWQPDGTLAVSAAVATRPAVGPTDGAPTAPPKPPPDGGAGAERAARLQVDLQAKGSIKWRCRQSKQLIGTLDLPLRRGPGPSRLQGVRVAWSPWHFAAGTLAVTLNDQSVALVDARDPGRPTLLRHLQPPEGGVFGASASDGKFDVTLRWLPDGRTLHIARANGVEVFDFARP